MNGVYTEWLRCVYVDGQSIAVWQSVSRCVSAGFSFKTTNNSLIIYTHLPSKMAIKPNSKPSTFSTDLIFVFNIFYSHFAHEPLPLTLLNSGIDMCSTDKRSVVPLKQSKKCIYINSKYSYSSKLLANTFLSMVMNRNLSMCTVFPLFNYR